MTAEKLRDHWPEYVAEIRTAIKTTFLSADHVEEIIKVLLREHPAYDWRSVAALAKEAECSKEEVEHTLAKLFKQGLVVSNPRNEDQWGLLSRVKEKYPEQMWNQKGQFDLGQQTFNEMDIYSPDYYKGTNSKVVLDPNTFQPCPTPCPAPAPPGYKKTYALGSKEITVPYTTLPKEALVRTTTKLTSDDMFTAMNECLREVQKLISQAQELNEQVPLCLK